MGKTSKDKRDIFYRKAKEDGWRARSAFKLLHLDSEFKLFDGIQRVVDLCAAPGSWSQVISHRIYLPAKEEERDAIKIIAVDLQEMAPVEGVIQLQGDITKESTAQSIISYFGEGKKAQLVVSDGAPDVTGLHDMDEYIQSQLIVAALNIVTHILEDDGTFVAKIFRGANTDILYTQLKIFFSRVEVAKPQSSRNSSIEAFVVCRNFKLPEGYVPQMVNPMIEDVQAFVDSIDNEVNKVIVPFILCGDINNLDADMTYDLDFQTEEGKPYVYHDVVQAPIEPAYEVVLKKFKNFNFSYESARIIHDEEYFKLDEACGYTEPTDVNTIAASSSEIKSPIMAFEVPLLKSNSNEAIEPAPVNKEGKDQKKEDPVLDFDLSQSFKMLELNVQMPDSPNGDPNEEEDAGIEQSDNSFDNCPHLKNIKDELMKKCSEKLANEILKTMSRREAPADKSVVDKSPEEKRFNDSLFESDNI